MASYESYKRITGNEIVSGTITDADINSSALATWSVKWFYGQPCALSSGCCCLWTVPSCVAKMHVEAWGSGGNGHGSCACSRCHHYAGAGGGYYNSKNVSTRGGCTYRVCAGGVYPCCERDCVGCTGCASHVCGYNLCNFCAIGGAGGRGENSWQNACFSDWGCCVAPVANQGEFGMGNHRGGFDSNGGAAICRCWCAVSQPTAAPFIGTSVVQTLNCCNVRCGCWTVPYGHGGQGSMHNCCGSGLCGNGGTGGPGLVKITYV